MKALRGVSDSRLKKTGESGTDFAAFFQQIGNRITRPKGRKVVPMITLRELKKEVKVAEVKKRVPGAVALKESGIKIVVAKTVGSVEILVYENGFVVYTTGNRTTVFPLHECNEYAYDFCTGKQAFQQEDFENQEWYVRLFLEGEDRIERTTGEFVQKKTISYSAVAEDWSVLAEEDGMLDDMISREEIFEILELMTEAQRRVVKKKYFEEMNEKDIAEELGISQQAVSDALKKAIKRVHKKINRYQK